MILTEARIILWIKNISNTIYITKKELFLKEADNPQMPILWWHRCSNFQKDLNGAIITDLWGEDKH